MKPAIVQKDELYLCGFFAKNEGGNIWERYEKETAVYEQPELVNWAGYEARFYSADGECVFKGCRQKDKVASPHYELLVLPYSLWAVFEIDCKVDQGPQYAGVDA